jgi:hypothetical protein
MDEGAWRAYFAYLRNENKVYEGNRIPQWFRGSYTNNESRKAWFKAQPPLSPTDQYAVAINGDMYYLVNKANPRESLKLSDTGKLVKANIPTALARQLLGQAAAAQPGIPAAAPVVPAADIDGVRRRGRPAGGVANAAPAAQPAATVGDINVSDTMEEIGLDVAFLRLPRADARRLNVNNGVRVDPNGDRGAARRNNQLGAAGRVGRIIAVGDSKIYIIRLANQQIIASINIQPGNRNYILLGNENGNTMIPINSPAELVPVLQNRNLAEAYSYIIREYIAQNPHHLDEVRNMIQQHIRETKKS